MTPLHVVAELAGGIALPHGPLALDALLAWAEAQRLGLPPPSVGGVTPIEIPIEREPGGRFHLCSFSCSEPEWYEHRWINRRFPLAEAQMLGDRRLRRVQITAGPCKSYRLPLETQRLTDDRMHWYCVGDAEPIRDLLGLVGYLGKRRAVGLGRVLRWTVEACESWGDGFPIVIHGVALRTLPVDWPWLVEPDVAHRCLTYPYWQHEKEEPCAVPC